MKKRRNRGRMISKQAKPIKCEDGVDMISNLPDPVLHMILSGLPTTEEVIRTSILCKRWSYLWTSVSFIDIDYSRGLKPLNEFESNKFEEFVDRVLANQSFDLDSFRLSCSNYCDLSTIERWIFAALEKKVVSIDLMFCPDESDDIEFPKCPVNCDSLKVLRLFLYKRPIRLPYFKEFQGVRVLELNNVDVFDGLSDIAFASLNNLEDLSLIDCLSLNYSFSICIDDEVPCLNLKSLRIINGERFHAKDGYVEHNDFFVGSISMRCPKLVYFECAGILSFNVFISCSLSLKEAVIHSEEFNYGHMCEYLHVESLSISLYYVLQFIESEDDTLSLPNLKTLKLITTNDSSPNDAFIQFLISNIIFLPVLESLHLIIKESDGSNDGSGYWKLEEVETTRILTCHLKTVKFVGFRGEKLKLDIARALLEILSNFHKASSIVKLNAFLEDQCYKFMR